MGEQRHGGGIGILRQVVAEGVAGDKHRDLSRHGLLTSQLVGARRGKGGYRRLELLHALDHAAEAARGGHRLVAPHLRPQIQRHIQKRNETRKMY